MRHWKTPWPIFYIMHLQLFPLTLPFRWRHFYFSNICRLYSCDLSLDNPLTPFSYYAQGLTLLVPHFAARERFPSPPSFRLTYIRIGYIKEFLSRRGLLRIVCSTCAASLLYGAAGNEHHYSMIAWNILWLLAIEGKVKWFWITCAARLL